MNVSKRTNEADAEREKKSQRSLELSGRARPGPRFALLTSQKTSQSQTAGLGHQLDKPDYPALLPPQRTLSLGYPPTHHLQGSKESV